MNKIRTALRCCHTAASTELIVSSQSFVMRIELVMPPLNNSSEVFVMPFELVMSSFYESLCKRKHSNELSSIDLVSVILVIRVRCCEVVHMSAGSYVAQLYITHNGLGCNSSRRQFGRTQ